jgi:hypothetical protein
MAAMAIGTDICLPISSGLACFRGIVLVGGFAMSQQNSHHGHQTGVL